MEDVQNNNDADDDDATTSQEPSSLHWSDPLSGEKFILSFPLQTFKLFEKLADQDRERQLTELQKRQESRCVPPAVQELEVTAEPAEATEEQSAEAAQTERSTPAAGDAPAAPTVSSQPDTSISSSSSSGQPPQGEQEGAAANTQSEE